MALKPRRINELALFVLILAPLTAIIGLLGDKKTGFNENVFFTRGDVEDA